MKKRKLTIGLIGILVLVEAAAALVVFPVVGIPTSDALGILLIFNLALLIGCGTYLMIHNPGADRRAQM